MRELQSTGVQDGKGPRKATVCGGRRTHSVQILEASFKGKQTDTAKLAMKHPIPGQRPCFPHFETPAHNTGPGHTRIPHPSRSELGSTASSLCHLALNCKWHPFPCAQAGSPTLSTATFFQKLFSLFIVLFISFL